MKYQSKGTKAAIDVLAARQDQVATGEAAYLDDIHDRGELADAAACAIVLAGRPGAESGAWPAPILPFVPTADRRRDLVSAACYLLAEIERLDRLELIQPEDVDRNVTGWWTHSRYLEGCPDGELTSEQCDDWFLSQRLEVVTTYMEDQVTPEVYNSYFDPCDCSAWSPEPPVSDAGWFALSIHDTEDGPLCIWGRRY